MYNQRGGLNAQYSWINISIELIFQSDQGKEGFCFFSLSLQNDFVNMSENLFEIDFNGQHSYLEEWKPQDMATF